MADFTAVQGTIRTTTVQASTTSNPSHSPIAKIDFAIKRTAHGSSAWLVPDHLRSSWQPQDGATRAEAAFDGDATTTNSADSSRSLTRRLMGLNITVASETTEPIRKPANRSLQLVGKQVA
jgi:hypothetical protein